MTGDDEVPERPEDAIWRVSVSFSEREYQARSG